MDSAVFAILAHANLLPYAFLLAWGLHEPRRVTVFSERVRYVLAAVDMGVPVAHIE